MHCISSKSKVKVKVTVHMAGAFIVFSDCLVSIKGSPLLESRQILQSSDF